MHLHAFRTQAEAIKYFAASIAVIIGLCFVLDRWVLPYLEDSGKLVAAAWRTEDRKIRKFMMQRNMADQNCAIWRSAGIPVTIKRNKPKRILVMGDSFVWGDGASNVNTLWWRQLQRELERRGYWDVEVIAAGLVNASTHDELTWAKKLVPLYAPDLVIWGYVENDPDETIPGSKKHWVPNMWCLHHKDNFSNDAMRMFETAFPNLADQLTWIRYKRWCKLFSGSEIGYDESSFQLAVLRGKNFEQYKQTVKELFEFRRSCQIPMFVMALPSYPGYRHYTCRYKPVEKLYTDNGIFFANPIVQFERYAIARHTLNTNIPPERQTSYWLVNPANAHPGLEACHFLADYAATILEKQYPQVLGLRYHSEPSMAVLKINDWVPPSIALQQLSTGTFQFKFPNSEADMLQMPIRKPYMQLNLERPTALSSLEVRGRGLQSAEVYLSSEDIPHGYDDHVLHKLDEKSGSIVAWDMPSDCWTSSINTIRISAKVSGPDRMLTLKLKPRSR